MKGTNCCEASEKKKSVNLYFAKLSLKESLVLIVLFGVGYSSEVGDKKKREGGELSYEEENGEQCGGKTVSNRLAVLVFERRNNTRTKG